HVTGVQTCALPISGRILLRLRTWRVSPALRGVEWAFGRTSAWVVPSGAHRVASTVGRVQPAGRITRRLRTWRVSPALRGVELLGARSYVDRRWSERRA